MEEEQRQRMARELRAIEAELGLPDAFLDNLVLEDDWSLVIKAHALIEATISNLLATTLDARLRPIFERLELGNITFGKLAFAGQLGLVTGPERAFIRRFSELRNQLVHNVRQASFRFGPWLDALEPARRNAFVDAVMGVVGTGQETMAARLRFMGDPGSAVWAATMYIVLRTLTEARRAQAMAVIKEAATSGWGRTH